MARVFLQDPAGCVSSSCCRPVIIIIGPKVMIAQRGGCRVPSFAAARVRIGRIEHLSRLYGITSSIPHIAWVPRLVPWKERVISGDVKFTLKYYRMFAWRRKGGMREDMPDLRRTTCMRIGKDTCIYSEENLHTYSPVHALWERNIHKTIMIRCINHALCMRESTYP